MPRRKCEKTGRGLGECAFALATALLICAPAWAGEGERAGGVTSGVGEVSDKDLKKPWDFAPEERVIVGRERDEYVRKGTLLSDAEHVDEIRSDEELWERRIALYNGERSDAGASAEGDGTPRDEGEGAVGEDLPQEADGDRRDLVRGWAKAGLAVVIVGALLAGLALGRKRG